MDIEKLKILTIFIILIPSFYYTIAYSPFFNITTFVLISVTVFLFFYFSSSRIRQNIEKIIEDHSKLFLIAIIFLSLIILYEGGLFENGIIIFQDYSFHFYRTNLLTNTLLPKFGNIVGWTQEFQAGMPEFYDYPPLPYFMTSSLYYAFSEKIPLTSFFRIIVAIAFLIPIIGIYRFAKSLFQKSFIAILASLIWLGFPHIQFLSGNYTTYFALGFAFLGLSFYHDYVKHKRKHDLFLASIFFGTTILSNPMIIVPAFIVAFFEVKRLSLRDILILTVGILGIAFIWFVQIYDGSGYLFYIHSESLLVYPEWFNLFIQFFDRFLIVSPALFFLMFLGVIYKLEKSSELLLLSIISLIIFLVVVERLQPIISILTLLQPEKTIMFIRGLLAILAIYLSYNLSKQNNLFKSKLLKSAVFALILMAFVGSSLIYIPYNIIQWHDNSVTPYLSDGIFSFGFRLDVKETFDFLKNLTTNQRILFEDSKKDQFGSTSIISLGPYYTGKNFIGGPFYHIALEDQNATAGDGLIFGKNITEYTVDQINQNMNAFNIGYVTAWTPQFIDFLSKNPGEFRPVFASSDGFIHVFQFLDSRNNYAETNNSASLIKTVKFGDQEMLFEVENATKGDLILVKSTYDSHWKGYINDKPVVLEKGYLHLISVSATKSGNLSLKIAYEATFLDKIAPFISILSFVLFLMLGFLFWKKRQK